jgi:hypothetical protein
MSFLLQRYSTIPKKVNIFIPHSIKDNKPIFNIGKNDVVTSISNARDVYNNCSKLSRTRRKDMYVSYNLDEEAVEKYIEIVENLENTLYPQEHFCFSTSYYCFCLMNLINFLICKIIFNFR